MEEKKVKDLWWKPAVTIFSNVSAWIAGPIILALILGKYLDKRYNSAPWFFISLTILSFIISITAIWKILKKYIKDMELEAKKAKSNKVGSPDDSVETFREKLTANKENGNNDRI